MELVMAKKREPSGDAKKRNMAPSVTMDGRSSDIAAKGPFLPGGRLKPMAREDGDCGKLALLCLGERGA